VFVRGPARSFGSRAWAGWRRVASAVPESHICESPYASRFHASPREQVNVAAARFRGQHRGPGVVGGVCGGRPALRTARNGGKAPRLWSTKPRVEKPKTPNFGGSSRRPRGVSAATARRSVGLGSRGRRGALGTARIGGAAPPLCAPQTVEKGTFAPAEIEVSTTSDSTHKWHTAFPVPQGTYTEGPPGPLGRNEDYPTCG